MSKGELEPRRTRGFIGTDKEGRPALVLRGPANEVFKEIETLVRLFGGETRIADLVRRHRKAPYN